MFVNRERELEVLEEQYQSNRFSCVVLYGRRRVGKTALITEFTRDKRCVFFTGIESTAEQNLELLSQSIYACEKKEGEAPLFRDYNAALDAIVQLAMNEKLVFVIDEYPYLARAYSAISSLLQTKIDMRYQKMDMMIILCGSSMSFMEQQVLGYQSPLYGRRTAQMKLQPFNYFEIRNFYKRFTDEELVTVFAMTGGIPKYLLCIDENKTLEDNIIEQFFSPSGYLFEEANNLTKQELRDPSIYNAIIRAIADGCVRVSEISDRLQIAATALPGYLSRLAELGIVGKRSPIGSPEGKKTRYYIADSYFRFWHALVPGRLMLISRGYAKKAYETSRETIQTLLGAVFEDICQTYMWEHYEEMPAEFMELGKWWGTNPGLKQQEEIDLVGLGTEHAVFAECKWRGKRANTEVLHELVRRSELIHVLHRSYVIFSKSGFDESLQSEAAKAGDVRLISFNDMCSGRIVQRA